MEYYNIYLDDERQCPQGFHFAPKTAKETIHLLQTFQKNGERVGTLSLDHDLGDVEQCGNGYQVLLWLEQQVALNGAIPPREMKVHSANAGARPKMEAAISQIYRMFINRSGVQTMAAKKLGLGLVEQQLKCDETDQEFTIITDDENSLVKVVNYDN